MLFMKLKRRLIFVSGFIEYVEKLFFRWENDTVKLF